MTDTIAIQHTDDETGQRFYEIDGENFWSVTTALSIIDKAGLPPVALITIGLLASLLAPATAATTVIATLGEAPLFGAIPSTNALVMAVFRNSDRFQTAAEVAAPAPSTARWSR